MTRPRSWPRSSAVVKRVGWCVVVASEGIRDADGRFVADAGGGKDSFGHTQLGGVAAHLAGRVKDVLGHKVHWTLPDYLQRSARHIASKTDLEHALAVGRKAVEFALAGKNSVMPVDRADLRLPLPLDRRGRTTVEGRQSRENHAGRIHPQGRIRDHRRGKALPATAHRRRSISAIWPGWATELR